MLLEFATTGHTKVGFNMTELVDIAKVNVLYI